jgi:hypothetical protein
MRQDLKHVNSYFLKAKYYRNSTHVICIGVRNEITASAHNGAYISEIAYDYGASNRTDLRAKITDKTYPGA